jgi:hypothetical protein
MDNDQTPSDVVAARVREVRKRRDLTTAQLAARCAGLGAPQLTTQAIYKIEGQRESATRPARRVTVDELLALALALDVAPVHLMVPVDDSAEPYHVTATVAAGRSRVRGWIRGHALLERFPRAGASRDFYSEQPEEDVEWGRLTDTALGKGRDAT